MPGKSPKYSAVQNGAIKVKVLDALLTAKDAITIDSIKAYDPELTYITTQKISRVLGELCDMGMVRKAKSKSLGRMVYKSTAVMQEEGYEVN